MPVNNVTAAMSQASDYLRDYAATSDSARGSTKIDAREFVIVDFVNAKLVGKVRATRDGHLVLRYAL